MRIIAIYPSFDININEMAMVWQQICKIYPVNLFVITSLTDKLKGVLTSTAFEDKSNIQIFRFPDLNLLTDEILSIARAFKPELIFCAVTSNMALAIRLKKLTGARIVLHNEFFFENKLLLRRRYYLGINRLQIMAGLLYRKWLLKSSSLILCSNPKELGQLSKSLKIMYLPWPHPTIPIFQPNKTRNKNYSAFIGSISKTKGADNLNDFYQFLMSDINEMRLSIIGPVIDKTGLRTVKDLKNSFPNRIFYRRNCSRLEAMAEISKSYFVFSPGTESGWGLIGDAWNNGTPILAFSEHYDLKSYKNCIVTKTPQEFLETILQLRDDENLWSLLSDGGRNTAQLHSLEFVSTTLFEKLLTLSQN